MNHRSQSKLIVNFLTGLMPVYSLTHVEGYGEGARSLIDGTLVFPVSDVTCPEDEDFEPDDGKVLVFWQGDQTRKSIVLGDDLVHLAIIKYAEIQDLQLNGQESAANTIRHMAAHYTIKTGREIYSLDYEEEKFEKMLKLLNKLIDKLGIDIVFDALQLLSGRK